MTGKPDNPYADLERIFHEPNRLAIVSQLCGAADGMTFSELKEACGLTDGNLSRHLKTLQEADAVRMDKAFVAARPRTTVFITDTGRTGFVEYLATLEAVLQDASQKARGAAKRVRLRPV